MLASIAIVGRPNVGKSTLFNRLTHTRNALVNDLPGLTRDRQYGIAKINQQEVIVIDTGGIGIGTMQTAIELLMVKQTELALQEAQIILFLVDAKSGLVAHDESLAAKLRKLNKPILVVVNKIDGQGLETAQADFHRFGFGSCLLISAEHNLGMEELIAAIATRLPPAPIDPPRDHNNRIKITFVGRPNVGKSTLINRILGEERLVVHNQPGTTRDSIFIDFNHRGKEYVLVDTAGVRRRSKIHEKIEKFSIVKTLQAIAATHVVVFLIDATENITDQDLKLLGFILEEGKALVIAVNKWDHLLLAQRSKIKRELERRLGFLAFVKIHFISALHGTGVGNLFGSVNTAYFSATKEFKTAELNKILEIAVKNHQPPMVQGREIKPRYAHVGHYLPPTIIIHGTRIKFLPESYRRYLEHCFRKALNLTGTPVKIVYKTSQA